jgi:hypothetical protein
VSEVNLNIEDILAQLSANGKLEWECAVLRAQNAALQQQLIPDTDEAPVEE